MMELSESMNTSNSNDLMQACFWSTIDVPAKAKLKP